jgi:hypothetical protein
VRDDLRPTYKYNPRMVPVRMASKVALENQDVCILVNCALESKFNVDGLPGEFVEALEPFVRGGRGLVIFSGDQVDPEAYNKVFGEKLGLLPAALKSVVKAENVVQKKVGDKVVGQVEPFVMNRSSFGSGPKAFWKFKEDLLFKSFDEVQVFQHLEIDEGTTPKWTAPRKKKNKDEADADRQKEKEEAESDKKKPEVENVLDVIVRLKNNKALAVSRKADAGEVVFYGSAVNEEGKNLKTNDPNWSTIHYWPALFFMAESTIALLIHNQTQTYNLTAGETLRWQVKDKAIDQAHYLVHPDGKRIDRLGVPEKEGERFVVTASDLPRAGVYRMTTLPRGSEATAAIEPAEAVKTGTPIAVIPDLTESADLTSLTAEQIDKQLGFPPIHIVAGQSAGTASGADRLNREWTTWALLLVMALVLIEVAFAWWCGRAW